MSKSTKALRDWGYPEGRGWAQKPMDLIPVWLGGELESRLRQRHHLDQLRMDEEGLHPTERWGSGWIYVAGGPGRCAILLLWSASLGQAPGLEAVCGVSRPAPVFRMLRKMHSWVLSTCGILVPSLEPPGLAESGTKQTLGGDELGQRKEQGLEGLEEVS